MSKFIKNTLVVSFGSMFAQVISILTIPILTRIYSPEEYGAYNLFLVMVLFVLPIASWRFNAAMILPKSNVRGLALLLISLVAVLLTTILSVIVIQLAYEYSFLPDVWQDNTLSIIIWLLPVVILINGIGQVGLFWCTRFGRFRILAVSRINETLLDRGVAILAGLSGNLGWGLYAGRLVGSVVYTVSIFSKSIFDKKQVKHLLKNSDYLINVSNRYKSFPIVSSWSFILDGLGRHGPLLILAYFYAPELIGQYALAVQILNMPMSLIGDALANVFIKQAVKFKNDKVNIRKYIYVILKISIYLLLPMMFFLLSKGEYVFSLVFGEVWGQAGVFVGVLSIAIIAMFLHRVLGSLFEVYERLKSRLVFDALLFITRLVMAYYMASNGYSMYALVFSLSMLSLIIYLFALIYLAVIVELNIIKIRNIFIKSGLFLWPVIMMFAIDMYYQYYDLLMTILWGGAILLSGIILYIKEKEIFTEIRMCD